MSNAQLSGSNVNFGGPDLTSNNLRDILLQSIDAIPEGGNIDWMCYYLNDASILQALVKASLRGVAISLFIDASPRLPSINTFSIHYLRKHAPEKINVIAAHKKPLWEHMGLNWHPHFHTKLYYFSHPTPQVYIGSYNPTAGANELSEEFIEEIGDHSISHNVLVNVKDGSTVALLREYISNMKKRSFRSLARVIPWHNRTHCTKEWKINFLPVIGAHPIQKLLTTNEEANIKCAISHLKGPGIERLLAAALRTGKHLEILLDATERRVPRKILSFLDQNNIQYHQPKLPVNCLMHNKYILYKSDIESKVTFGSFNWSARSRYLNHEIIVTSNNRETVAAFDTRWNQVIASN